MRICFLNNNVIIFTLITFRRNNQVENVYDVLKYFIQIYCNIKQFLLGSSYRSLLQDLILLSCKYSTISILNLKDMKVDLLQYVVKFLLVAFP